MFKQGLLLGLTVVAALCAAQVPQAQQDGSDVMTAEWTGVAVLCEFYHDKEVVYNEIVADGTVAPQDDFSKDDYGKKSHGRCKFKYCGKVLYFDVYDDHHKGGGPPGGGPPGGGPPGGGPPGGGPPGGGPPGGGPDHPPVAEAPLLAKREL